MTFKKTLPWVLLASVLCVGLLVLVLRSPLRPLSQSELSAPRIYAYRDWQRVGIQLQPGDRFSVRARGEWLYTPGEYHGPEGHARYRAPNFYPIPAIPGGILLARVGEEGTIFPVGRGGTFVAHEAGQLLFRINDDILSDNEGYVTVEVQVMEAEPGP